MSVTLYCLRIFRIVYEGGSLAAAAQAAVISSSAVSHQIAQLEALWGVPLFQRRGRQLQPTAAGRLVYEHVVRILEEYRALERQVTEYQAARQGSIVAAGSIVPGTYWLPAVVSAFKRQHPQAQVHLQVLPAAELEEALVSGRLDCGVTPIPLSHPDLTLQTLGPLEVVLVASPQYPRPDWPRHLADLTTAPFICAPHETRGRRHLDNLLARRGIVRQHVLMEMGHPEGIKRAVQAGLGIALLYRLAVEPELARHELVTIPLPEPLPRATFYVATLKHRYQAPLLLEFLSHLRHAWSATFLRRAFPSEPD